MRIQIWTNYYEPEPMGIAPMAHRLATDLVARGHSVAVVTSHPHYPRPAWGRSFRPHRRVSGGVDVLELPIYVRRDTRGRRLLAEATYGLAQSVAALSPRAADVVVAVLPSLLVAPAASLHSRLYGVPWVVWLQDIVSAAARHTGMVGSGRRIELLQRIESYAFRRSSRVITIAQAFSDDLRERGVPREKIELIYLAATTWPEECHVVGSSPSVLSIGNIGLTQNLPSVTQAFLASPELASIGARLRITGHGVETPALMEACDDGRARFLGLLPESGLQTELTRAEIGLITQHPSVADFNLPSKLTTYLAHGVPVLAIVSPESEVAEIVRRSHGGWVVDSDDLGAACRRLAELLADAAGRREASVRGHEFALRDLDPGNMAARFEGVLREVVGPAGSAPPDATAW